MLIHEGWKVRKDPVAGEVFFLTFSFIELRRHCILFGTIALQLVWAHLVA